MNLTTKEGKIDFSEIAKDDLESAILLCLFTDARATEEEYEEVKDWAASKGGYWADEINGHEMGSKLWLLKRSPKDQETLERAKNYAEESLAWLLDEMVATELDVKTSWQDDDLKISVIADKKPSFSGVYRL